MSNFSPGRDVKRRPGADGGDHVNVVVADVLHENLQHAAVLVLGSHVEGREARRVPVSEAGPVVDEDPGGLLVAALTREV